MAIEQLQDILEELADRFYIYGSHGDPELNGRECRACFVGNLRERIEHAVEIGRKLQAASPSPLPTGEKNGL